MSAHVDGWWAQFFDDTYATIGLEAESDEAKAKREWVIDLIVAKLELRAGDTVLDQCCGIGRLSLPLARRGLRVIGVDQAAGYIDVARTRATAAGLDCEFHAADGFEFVAPRPCDAVINWFTSFGYHRDDRVNLRMLQRAYESLRPGGWFGLDYISLPRVLSEFKTCMFDRVPRPDGELLLIQEPSIDFSTGMMSGTWTFIRPDGSREVRRVENRAYMPYDLIRMFEQARFVDVDVIGVDGMPFDRTSRRCIVLGRRLLAAA